MFIYTVYFVQVIALNTQSESVENIFILIANYNKFKLKILKNIFHSKQLTISETHRKNHCKNLTPRTKLLKILLLKGRLIYTGTMTFSFAKVFDEFSVIFIICDIFL